MTNKRNRLPRLRLNVHTEEQFDEFTEDKNVKHDVYQRFIESVKDANKESKEEADIYKIENRNLIISIDKAEWKNVLSNALNFYIEQEEFKLCAELRDLIKSL